MMTSAELEQLPVTFGLATAARALGIGRNQAYALVKAGQFPVRVLRLCGRYKVSRYDLLAYLGAAPGYAPDGQPAGDDGAGAHAPLRPVPADGSAA